MNDPRKVAILIKFKNSNVFEDKTTQCEGFRFSGNRVYVTLARKSDSFEYPFTIDSFRFLENPTCVAMGDSHLVRVQGTTQPNVTEVWQFTDGSMTWYRVFATRDPGRFETYKTYQADEVELIPNAKLSHGQQVLDYFKRIVDGLKEDDPLHGQFTQMSFIHRDSVLARYLEGRHGDTYENQPEALLFPFAYNASQQKAVETSLRYSISVIDGPPGTGKTQTILNLIGNIIRMPGKTVGIVSFNNAAVENVREKLVSEGIGFVAAWLGNQEKCTDFFSAQKERTKNIQRFLEQPTPLLSPDANKELEECAKKLEALYAREREIAELSERLAAYRNEQRHFESNLPDEGLPDLEAFPLLRRSSQRIMQYLAESEIFHDEERALSRFVARVRGYFLYGTTKFLDLEDTASVLQVQQGFYSQRIAELERQMREADRTLKNSNFDALKERHRVLSVQLLHQCLQQRYGTHGEHTYSWKDYKRKFDEFIQDYPVILSTCHSLRKRLPEGRLLDYLIIDEASQVNLPVAALAMSMCRNLIVVGDECQLGQITERDAARSAGDAPFPAFEYEQHSILTSLIALYGDALPRTMLREHYRCHPDIIGYCNKRFYGGKLIPFTQRNSEDNPLRVIRTSPGNHMRQYRDKGKINEREAQLIAQHIIPEYYSDVATDRIGITTPYRRQVKKISSYTSADPLDVDMAVDTVHKFQGREKDIVIMSTVLDGTRQGAIASRFVDDDRLINVAVSRAVQQFVLVTHHKDLPRAQNIRDLIGYISYRYPQNCHIDTTVISVFDLLYAEYSERLRSLASKLRGNMQYKSEEIIRVLLQMILSRPEYRHVGEVSHMRLCDLFRNKQGLSAKQVAFINTSSHFDFILFNKITNCALLAIEVDGFKYHEDNPAQLERDKKKDSICAARGLAILRLPTTSSGEEARIVAAVNAALRSPSNLAMPDVSKTQNSKVESV